MNIYIYIYVYINIYLYICIYINIYTDIHTHIYIHGFYMEYRQHGKIPEKSILITMDVRTFPRHKYSKQA